MSLFKTCYYLSYVSEQSLLFCECIDQVLHVRKVDTNIYCSQVILLLERVLYFLTLIIMMTSKLDFRYKLSSEI